MKQLLALAVVLAVATGYPYGPPMDACGDMFPTLHNTSASNDPCPFEIKIDSTCYKRGKTIEIEVKVKAGEVDNYFEGLFLQARTYTGENGVGDMAHGVFANNKKDADLKTMDCFDKDASAISQIAKAHYTTKTFQWTAPKDMKEDLVFQGTIVHETDEFWTGVLSDIISHNSSCTRDPMPGGAGMTCPLVFVTITMLMVALQWVL